MRSKTTPRFRTSSPGRSLFAGADLATPERNYFFVSLSPRPGVKFEIMREAVESQVERLFESNDEAGPVSVLARQLAASLSEIPDLKAMKAQAPPGAGLARIEGKLGLQLGMHEHRYGDHRSVLAKQVSIVTAAKVQAAARQHLDPGKAVVRTVQPALN